MRGLTELSFILFMGLMTISQAERLYVNDKKVPESRDDLLAIQSALQKHLVKAKKSTVCLKVGQGSGTGVIISSNGLVLTAAHVVGGVDREVTVLMEDGSEYVGRSLGLNARNDAAMVQIEGEGPFPFVEYEQVNAKGDKSTRVGDWVFALGHSGGFDIERGLVVRLGRLLRAARSTVQSDCKLIGGDSGGPLFDLNGTLIGIHSRVGRRLAQNMHVPLQVFHEDWMKLKEGEFVEEGPFAKKPKPGAALMGISVEVEQEELRVTQVEPGRPAEKAGVQVGDILKKVDDTEVKTREEFSKLKEKWVEGDVLTLLLSRNGKALELRLTLTL